MFLAQTTNVAGFWHFFASRKDAFDSVESVFKIVAIIVGGIWAYLLFVRKRERYPRAELQHQIEFWNVSETERLLRVTLAIENKSDVLMRVRDGFTWIQQMKPWPDELIQEHARTSQAPEEAKTEIPWPLIGEKNHQEKREIEPKEFDKITMDFIIEKTYEQVLVYSFIKNFHRQGRNLGWSISTIKEFTQRSETVTTDQGQVMKKPRPQAAKLQPKDGSHNARTKRS